MEQIAIFYQIFNCEGAVKILFKCPQFTKVLTVRILLKNKAKIELNVNFVYMFNALLTTTLLVW